MGTTGESDVVFSGSVPELYDRYLVPLIFEQYAADLTNRVRDVSPASVLEIAAGSGVLTRSMAENLPSTVTVTASDLSQAMLDHAQTVGVSRPIEFRVADVMDLPFEDASFDVVVCQFGVMFFPDKSAAYAEVQRVLRPGGTFVFNVWDKLDSNEFAYEVTKSLGARWPDDPPQFLGRVPHGYYEQADIQADLAGGGFVSPARYEKFEARSLAETPDIPAIAYCQGTPLRNEIEARDPGGLQQATKAATDALRRRFGATNLDSKIRGFVITASKPS